MHSIGTNIDYSRSFNIRTSHLMNSLSHVRTEETLKPHLANYSLLLAPPISGQMIKTPLCWSLGTHRGSDLTRPLTSSLSLTAITSVAFD